MHTFFQSFSWLVFIFVKLLTILKTIMHNNKVPSTIWRLIFSQNSYRVGSVLDKSFPRFPIRANVKQFNCLSLRNAPLRGFSTDGSEHEKSASEIHSLFRNPLTEFKNSKTTRKRKVQSMFVCCQFFDFFFIISWQVGKI